MTETTISRVNYFDRQFLRRQDFADEQQYHLVMRRRHNIAHHGWGIVSGLKLVFDEGVLFLEAGMAIDGYGRELIQPRRTELPVNTFVSEVNDAVDVWLLYEQIDSEPAQRGLDDAPDDGQTDYYRLQEVPRVMLTKAGFNPADARKPPQVPQGDYTFAPYRTPSDDPDHTWPVFLGYVRWAKADEPPIISMSGRPMVTAVASQVTAPTGAAAIQLGSDDPNHSTQFAIFSPNQKEVDESATPWLELAERPLAEDDAPDTPKQMEFVVRGKTVFHNNVHLKAGQLSFEGTSQTPDNVSAFRFYRFLNRQKIAQSASEDDVEQVQNQLRVEIAKQAHGEGQFVVGAWSEEAGAFEPCLTIDTDKNLTVHGNLVVEGRVIEKTVRATAGLSQDAQNLAQVAALTGMAGSSQLLGNVYRSPFTAQTKEASELLASPEELGTFITALLEDAEAAQPFFDELMKHPKGKSAIINESVSKAASDVLNKLATPPATEFVNTAVTKQAAKIIDALIKSDTQKANLVSKVVAGLTTEVVNEVIKNQQKAVLDRIIEKAPVTVINRVIAKDLDKVIDKTIIADADKVINKIVTSHTRDVIADVVSRAATDVIGKLLATDADTLIDSVLENQQTAVMQKLVSTQATPLANGLWDEQIGAQLTSLKAKESRLTSLIDELKKAENATLREALLDGLIGNGSGSEDAGGEPPATEDDDSELPNISSGLDSE